MPSSFEDDVLERLERLLDGSVGSPLSPQEWESAVDEGHRRVAEQIPPGYLDAEKAQTDLPEGAAGDYLVWCQLLIECGRRRCDLVLVSSDRKKDWRERRGDDLMSIPRMELVEEYRKRTGGRFFVIEPAELLKHAEALQVDANPASVEEIERVREDVDRAYSVAKIREQHPRAYQPWNEEEDEHLRRMARTGVSSAEIATSLGRQRSAIESRLRKLVDWSREELDTAAG